MAMFSLHIKMLNAKVPLLSYCVLIALYISTHDHIIAKKSMHYILQWNVQNSYAYLGPGQRFFLNRKCKYTNCYVTNDTNYFNNYKNFDAIIFNLIDLVQLKHNLPNLLPSAKKRSKSQKYIFTSTEAPVRFPLCKPFLDDYFNWTWTYKLNSNIRRGYITIYNLKGQKIGPKSNMKWIKNMNPTDENLKSKLRLKSKLAAWFVSNCYDSKNGRLVFANQVIEELKKLESQTVDIFGKCGRYDCPKSKRCARMLKRDYFFYFSFENSFSEDYVTEKLMTALDNYNVPVVYGGADYNKFLPPGSYLNARDLGPKRLAEKMLEIASNESAYHDFFRWRNHYKYRETTHTDDICKLCEIMNNSKLMKRKTVKRNFTKWWEGDCKL